MAKGSNSIDTSLKLSGRVEQLKEMEFFSGISEPILTKLAGMMKEVRFTKNNSIISQGERSRSLYVITDGRAKVFITDEQGHQTIYSFLKKGDYFGELSLLDDAPRSATVVTLEDITALILSHAKFNEFVNNHPGVCWSLFKALSTRMRQMDETIYNLTTRDIYGRLAETLYNEAEEQEDGTLITQKLTHQDLAEMIGSSREMISRIFSDLKQGDYIKVEQKRITILKRLPTNW
jgi:CRP/FNR family cyclic AMP-dependent transcriptional regulator